MLTTERELGAAIYLLYASECIHWLKQGQAAMTLRWDGTWRKRQATEESYTLAGRMPVVVNPIDLRAAYIKIHHGRMPSIIDRLTGRLIPDKLPGMGLLTSFSVLGALNLLVVLPLLLHFGYLEAWWRPIIGFVISIQLVIAVEVFELARHWRKVDPAGFWREYVALLLNPIAALRSGDILLKGLSKIADSDSPLSTEEPSE